MKGEGCPTGTYLDQSTSSCLSMSSIWNSFILTFNFLIGCPTACAMCYNDTSCVTCISNYLLLPLSNGLSQCVESCPSGYYPNSTAGKCEACASSCSNCTGPTLSECTARCPLNCENCSSAASCDLCSSGYYLLNDQCQPQCPSTLYQDESSRRCVFCPTNCAACGASGCSKCQTSRYLYNNTCYISCPAFTYVSTVSGSNNLTCSDCDSSCLTCIGPGPTQCTLCQLGLFLYEKQCLRVCPSGTYESKLEMGSDTAIPSCKPKIVLSMSRRFTSDPRKIFIAFSTAIGLDFLNYFISVLQITLQGATLDASLISAEIFDNSTISLTLLVERYIPEGAILDVNLSIGADFDNDPTNKYAFPVKHISVALAEYYPFMQTEDNVISGASDVAKGSSTASTAAQTAAMATGSVTNFLLQFSLITDLIQLLQFIDINWPPNVMNMFREAYMDPSNLFIPVCYFPRPESCALPNYTLPRSLEIQAIPPVFLMNDCYVASTLILGISIIILLKVWLQFKKPSIIPQQVAKLGTLLDRLLAWNIYFQVFMSNYTLFVANVTLQIYYLNFDSPYMALSSALALLAGIFCVCFPAFASVVVWRYSKIENNAEAKKKFNRYEILFEGLRTQKRVQIFYIPFSFVRVLLIGIFVIVFSGSTWTLVILICMIQATFCLYVITYRPHESKFECWITIITELLALTALLLGLGIMINLETNPTIESRIQLGWALISMNFAVSIATVVSVAKQLLSLLISIYKKLRQRCRQKQTRVVPIFPTTKHSIHSAATTANCIYSKTDLDSVLDQIESAQTLIKNKLKTLPNNQDEINFQITEKQEIESLLKNTVILFDGANTSSVQSQTSLKKYVKRMSQTSLHGDISPIEEVPSSSEILPSIAGTIFLDSASPNEKISAASSGQKFREKDRVLSPKLTRKKKHSLGKIRSEQFLGERVGKANRNILQTKFPRSDSAIDMFSEGTELVKPEKEIDLEPMPKETNAPSGESNHAPPSFPSIVFKRMQTNNSAFEKRKAKMKTLQTLNLDE